MRVFDIYTNKAAKDRHRVCALLYLRGPIHGSTVAVLLSGVVTWMILDLRGGPAPLKPLSPRFFKNCRLPLEINLFGLPFSNPLV